LVAIVKIDAITGSTTIKFDAIQKGYSLSVSCELVDGNANRVEARLGCSLDRAVCSVGASVVPAKPAILELDGFSRGETEALPASRGERGI
jgi:hypothetical protein